MSFETDGITRRGLFRLVIGGAGLFMLGGASTKLVKLASSEAESTTDGSVNQASPQRKLYSSSEKQQEANGSFIIGIVGGILAVGAAIDAID